jgi:hypothetical protein
LNVHGRRVFRDRPVAAELVDHVPEREDDAAHDEEDHELDDDDYQEERHDFRMH